jgi:hypothetical protein
MVGLIISIIIFNLIAFKTNKLLRKTQILHIWLFTVAFNSIADLFIDAKYHGYWYFSKGIEWETLLSMSLLIPPVNIIFLNLFPFRKSFFSKLCYIFLWVTGLIIYECLTLLPPPIGFFHYGWWKLWYSALLNPFLLLSVLFFYKWICKLECDESHKKTPSR